MAARGPLHSRRDQQIGRRATECEDLKCEMVAQIRAVGRKADDDLGERARCKHVGAGME